MSSSRNSLILLILIKSRTFRKTCIKNPNNIWSFNKKKRDHRELLRRSKRGETMPIPWQLRMPREEKEMASEYQDSELFQLYPLTRYRRRKVSTKEAVQITAPTKIRLWELDQIRERKISTKISLSKCKQLRKKFNSFFAKTNYLMMSKVMRFTQLCWISSDQATKRKPRTERVRSLAVLQRKVILTMYLM